MSERRWIVSAGTTLQELDRLLRERALDERVTLTIVFGGERIFDAHVDGRFVGESRYLSCAIDLALAHVDDVKRRESAA